MFVREPQNIFETPVKRGRRSQLANSFHFFSADPERRINLKRDVPRYPKVKKKLKPDDNDDSSVIPVLA